MTTDGTKHERGQAAKPRRSADADFKVVFAMMAVLVIPAIIALLAIRQSSQPVFSAQNLDPSPLGYTWSLGLFIIPTLTLTWWFVKHPHYHLEKKPYWLTVMILTPVGFGLDLFFGNSFFTFENTAATLGIRLPGYTFGQGWVADSIPLEEFFFYFTGFLTILLVYIWSNQYWFGDYDVEDYRKDAAKVDRILDFHPPLAVAAATLIVAAILFKKFAAPPEFRDGFPGYFTFMVVIGIVPTTVLFKKAKPFINWRAFSFSFFLMLFLSLLWEGAMGVPYGWWGYRPEQMMGLVIEPLANLPVEAATLWFLATWENIMLYEVVKIIVHGKRPLWEALFGPRR
jgi:hypothetical protein